MTWSNVQWYLIMNWALGLSAACYKGIVQPMLITYSGSAVAHNTHDCVRPINLSLLLCSTLVFLSISLCLHLCPSGGSRESQASPAPLWWRASRWHCPPTKRPYMEVADPAVPPVLLLLHRLLWLLQSRESPSCSLRGFLRELLEARAPAEPATTET